MEIHERIKKLRNELCMTQDEFGKTLGVSRDVIGNIEYDRLKNPTQKEPLYKLICKEFHIREEWLRTGKEPKYSYGIGEDKYTLVVNQIDADDPRARQAILDYWELNTDDKELWWSFVERFLKK